MSVLDIPEGKSLGKGLFFLLCMIIAILSCRVNEKKKEKTDFYKIQVNKLISIGSEEEDVLIQWAGVAVDEEKNIYVSDTMNYSLFKFDSAGKLLKRIGRKGQGAGEFSAPRDVVCCGKLVYVSDQYQRYIQVFNIDLEYLYKIPTYFAFNDFEVISDNHIIVSASRPPYEHELLDINKKGEIIKRTKLSLDGSESLNNSVSFVIDEEGNKYISYNFVDRIEKMDSLGNVVWKKELLNGIKVKLENKNGYYLPSNIIYKDIMIDYHHRIYVLGGSFSTNKSRDVYVLDKQGAWIGTLTLPDTSHCIYVDSDGRIYSRANEGMTLLKMEIEFKSDKIK